MFGHPATYVDSERLIQFGDPRILTMPLSQIDNFDNYDVDRIFMGFEPCLLDTLFPAQCTFSKMENKSKALLGLGWMCVVSSPCRLYIPKDLEEPLTNLIRTKRHISLQLNDDDPYRFISDSSKPVQIEGPDLMDYLIELGCEKMYIDKYGMKCSIGAMSRFNNLIFEHDLEFQCDIGRNYQSPGEVVNAQIRPNIMDLQAEEGR